MLSCSIRFSAPSLWLDGGLESRCVGRVYGADGAVHTVHTALRYKSEGQLLVLKYDYTISPNSTPIHSARPRPTPQYSAVYSGYRLL